MINIGILGGGNIASGVINILTNSQKALFNKTGKKIRIKKVVVRDLSKKREFDQTNISLTTSPEEILDDPEIPIIVELIGGEKPAFDYICQALKNKKHVVTANKEVMAKHKTIFYKLAQENNVRIRFEAAVGGGIPLIQAIRSGYVANKINSVYGILNGTTNYILTKIEEEKLGFEEVLKKAQEKGFAEPDPTNDISGLDVAYKLNVLGALAFNVDLSLEDIYYEGIENMSFQDILYAKEFGYKIKLLAMGIRTSDNKLIFKIYPTMIPFDHPLAMVRNEFNALFINGDAVGEALLYGKGAGAKPTGSAVVSDIVDVVINIERSSLAEKTILEPVTNKLLPFEESTAQFYLRLLVDDHYGVIETISGVLSKNKISISKIIQKDVINSDAELVIVTHSIEEKNMADAIKELKELDAIKKLFSVIRVDIET